MNSGASLPCAAAGWTMRTARSWIPPAPAPSRRYTTPARSARRKNGTRLYSAADASAACASSAPETGFAGGNFGPIPSGGPAATSSIPSGMRRRAGSSAISNSGSSSPRCRTTRLPAGSVPRRSSPGAAFPRRNGRTVSPRSPANGSTCTSSPTRRWSAGRSSSAPASSAPTTVAGAISPAPIISAGWSIRREPGLRSLGARAGNPGYG